MGKLDYAFNWLKDSKGGNFMFGQLQLEQFIDDGRLPQKVATIWSGVDWAELTGAGYKPLLYLGPQPVNGILHWFIAEQTLVTYPVARHVVKMAILQKDDEYEVLKDSISIIV